MFNVLHQRNFTLLWFGQLISLIGDWVLFVALPFYVYELTGSALATGAMFIAQLLPRLLLGSVAGVFVDRWDRKRLMIIADVLRGLVLLLLLFVRSPEWLWLVYLVAFAQSAISQFFVPAKNAIIPLLVGERDLMEANSLNAVSDSLTRLLGPSIGGVLMAVLGLTSVVLVDSASFFISALLILLMAVPARSSIGSHQPAQGAAAAWLAVWRDWLAGLRLIRGHRVLLALFTATGLFEFSDSIFSALIVVFVKNVMRAGTQELGWMMAAQGLGGLLGGLVIARVAKVVSPVRLIVAACLAVGLGDLAIFNFPNFVFALVLIFPVGIFVVGAMVSINTLIQAGVADRYRGRVFGAFMTSGALMRLVGTLLAGALGDVLGVVPILQVGALLWLITGVLTLFMLPDQSAEAIMAARAEQAQPLIG